MSLPAQWRLLSDLHLGVSDEDARHPGNILPAFLHNEVLEPPAHSSTLSSSVTRSSWSGSPRTEPGPARVHPRPPRRHIPGTEGVRGARCAAALRVRQPRCGAGPALRCRPPVGVAVTGRAHEGPGSPWFLHVPHVLVAGHGHQHYAPPGARGAPSGGQRHRRAGPAAARCLEPASVYLAPEPCRCRCPGLPASERAERRVREVAYDELLQTESRRLALDGVAVRDLARLSGSGRCRRSRSPRPAWCWRPPGAEAPARGLLLQRADSYVPSRRTVPGSRYVSGHTHRALESALEACPTRYINTGTWCSDVRGRGPDQSDRRAFPYAMVDVAATAPQAADCGTGIRTVAEPYRCRRTGRGRPKCLGAANSRLDQAGSGPLSETWCGQKPRAPLASRCVRPSRWKRCGRQFPESPDGNRSRGLGDGPEDGDAGKAVVLGNCAAGATTRMAATTATEVDSTRRPWARHSP